jgi:hypothetical protein
MFAIVTRANWCPPPFDRARELKACLTHIFGSFDYLSLLLLFIPHATKTGCRLSFDRDDGRAWPTVPRFILEVQGRLPCTIMSPNGQYYPLFTLDNQPSSDKAKQQQNAKHIHIWRCKINMRVRGSKDLRRANLLETSAYHLNLNFAVKSTYTLPTHRWLARHILSEIEDRGP